MAANYKITLPGRGRTSSRNAPVGRLQHLAPVLHLPEAPPPARRVIARRNAPKQPRYERKARITALRSGADGMFGD
jgi:hypothetical protein